MGFKPLAGLAVAFGCFALHPAIADDADALHGRLARVIEVLKLAPSEASASCISSLKEVHGTEDQLSHAMDQHNNPDIELAHDVLESEYQSAVQLCGVDARRVCEGKASAAEQKLVQPCQGLRQGSP